MSDFDPNKPYTAAGAEPTQDQTPQPEQAVGSSFDPNKPYEAPSIDANQSEGEVPKPGLMERTGKLAGKADEAITGALAPDPAANSSLLRTNAVEVPKTLGREAYSAGKTLLGMIPGAYHAVVDPATDEEKASYTQFEKEHGEAPGTETSGLKRLGLVTGRLTGINDAVNAAKVYSNPATRPTLDQALSVAPEALGAGAGVVLGAKSLEVGLPKIAGALKKAPTTVADVADSMKDFGSKAKNLNKNINEKGLIDTIKDRKAKGLVGNDYVQPNAAEVPAASPRNPIQGVPYGEPTPGRAVGAVGNEHIEPPSVEPKVSQKLPKIPNLSDPNGVVGNEHLEAPSTEPKISPKLSEVPNMKDPNGVVGNDHMEPLSTEPKVSQKLPKIPNLATDNPVVGNDYVPQTPFGKANAPVERAGEYREPTPSADRPITPNEVKSSPGTSMSQPAQDLISKLTGEGKPQTKAAAVGADNTMSEPARGLIKKLTGEDFNPEEGGDRRAEARPEGEERRTATGLRQRVDEMSPDEMKKALLTNPVTDMPNRRAFDEAEKTPAVAMSDADGLKAFNDRFGYEAGNELLKAKAEALKEAGLNAFHEKGDEFLYRGESPEDLNAKLEKARQILKDRDIKVTLADGSTKTFKGADFSYGSGEDLQGAEKGLKSHKADREANGERARGELRGITETGPKAGEEGGSPEEGSLEDRAGKMLDKVKATRAELAKGEEPKGEEPEGEDEGAEQYHPATQEQVTRLSNENLKKLGTTYGLDPEKYDFSKREPLHEGGSKHPVERIKFINDLMEAMPDKDKINVGRQAEDLNKNPGKFDDRDTSNKAKAERAASMFPQLRASELPELKTPHTMSDEEKADFDHAITSNIQMGPTALNELRDVINQHTDKPIKFLGQGNEHTVYDLGNGKIAKIRKGEAVPVPDLPEVLKPIAQHLIPAATGEFHVSILPKVETTNIPQSAITDMTAKLKEQGYRWDDAEGNIGRTKDGKYVVIDYGGLKPIKKE